MQSQPTPSSSNGKTLLPDPEPRWPVIVAALATSALYLSVPERLTPGPSWLLPLIVVVLLIPTVITNRIGLTEVNYVFGFIVSSVLTGALAWSLGMLIAGLPAKSDNPIQLLRAASALWICNILVFACWYWRLDAGGPHQRDLRHAHYEGAFLFPQMTLPEHSKILTKLWKPGFVDYLFLAFNTSTAFSPTDVPVLSRWAKGLMMVQSSISLGTLAILAARAVNIL
ncbi:MAG TPA: hypothetical protein VK604_19995 [Bryobacteraceae bacterium]|nr:hypothetical protein [Bryobacteraceae bacterium]